jgi:hypothetical protein
MEINAIPTEQTTAATDALVAIFAAVFAVILSVEGGRSDRTKGRIWSATFGLLAVAGVLGAIAHGIQMSERTNELLWMPLNLVLGVTVALFVAGAVYDLRSFSLPRLLVPFLLAVGVAFFLVTVLIPGSFLVFVIYEAIAMLFAFVVYIVLSVRRTLRGAEVMAVGVLVSIVAAAVQAIGAVRFTLIWEFDHNGVFHLIQMVALVCLLIGLRTDLVSRRGA